MTDLILAFDTSGPHCAAALMAGDVLLAEHYDAMARGQAEHLMGMLESVLARENATWADLSAIAVGVGPGNFTGIRISVSAARGLALGLGAPALGISTFQAWADPEGESHVLVPAPRDMAYVQPLSGLTPLAEPNHMPMEEATKVAANVTRIDAQDAPFGSLIAPRLAQAAQRFWQAGERPPAKPLYVKPPDAAPARDPAPTILT